ncbi:uncharacterized protein YjbJ (UPF0337 family) [Sphingomonas jejuensis]|uniref:Uncharacterized protein YjbJ (UPF0337 family) n=1 Tax=Sphingomonas jejuensis TaxID=904715 RepID=A0ABX0XJQ0_9SPHN|nr:CsbD family protein [Sphingomonas jejuensis]NJC33097.1 uncharacterized protein YjbJ (UPF0337 family) [Sphingomonas jejuensis]
MNNSTLEGATRDLGGSVKEVAGIATGDRSLEAEGRTDQFGGKLQKAYGNAADAVQQQAGPLADKARSFAKERPWATAALAGVVGIALLNTLRGKR